MKNRFLSVMALALGMAFMGTQSAEAQLGGLLKKVKKTVDTVVDVVGSTDAGVGEVNLAGGGTMKNPLASVADIQFVGAFGRSTSDNYGEVYFVLKVKMIANKTRISIGGNSDFPPLITDSQGNAYKLTLGWYNYDVVEGSYVVLTLKEHGSFPNVRKSAKMIQQGRIGISVDSDNCGFFTVKNVPILWDIDPQTVIAAHQE